MAKYGVPVNLDREGRKVHEEYHKGLEVNAKMALDVIDEAKDAGDYATAEGDRAKEFSDNIETVMKDGPTQTVNGRTGQVTGLAEQVDLDATNSLLADTVNVFSEQRKFRDLVGILVSRREGRTEISATTLVSLSLGDNPINDNTQAINTLLARTTLEKEIIKFPKGVIYVDRLHFKESMYFQGADDGETVFKLRPQTNKTDYPLINIAEHNGVIHNITFDGNKDNHVGMLGDCEGLDWKGGNNWLLWGVTSKNANQDAFDHDYSKHNIHVLCTSMDCGKDGFHNSIGTFGNEYYYCQAQNVGYSRGAFTSSENSLGGHVFENCVANDCRVGYEIAKGVNNVDNNIVINCQSIDNSYEDNFEGVQDGSKPANLVGGFRRSTFNGDLNELPKKSGVFAVSNDVLNQPSIVPNQLHGGTVIQSVSETEIIRQTFINATGNANLIAFRDNVQQKELSDWDYISLARTTHTIDFDNPPMNITPTVLYCNAASTNKPANTSGTLTYSISSGGSIVGMQYITSNREVFIRGDTKQAWRKVNLVEEGETHVVNFNNPPKISSANLYCGASSTNMPANIAGTLSYSTSASGIIAGMQYVGVNGVVYVRGGVADAWRKIETVPL